MNSDEMADTMRQYHSPAAPSPPMRISLLSDTHHNCEHSPEWPHPLPAHDVLVLAGDISEFVDWPSSLIAVLEHFRERTRQPILYVPGNHEFYRQDYTETLARLQRETDQLGIDLLHCRNVQHGDVLFHGCTLWSDFTLLGPELASQSGMAAEQTVGDFRLIKYEGRKFLARDCAELHRRERAWLEGSLTASTTTHNVVITHFAPIAECIGERYRGDQLNPYFIANCADLAQRFEPDLWLYGHTHTPLDFTWGKTRFVNNARGYPRELDATQFAPKKTIQIGD